MLVPLPQPARATGIDELLLEPKNIELDLIFCQMTKLGVKSHTRFFWRPQ